LSPTNVVRHRALYFVLRHFEKPIWTRTVSTYRTQGSQILVYNKEEVLAIYEQAKFLDSRVNPYTDWIWWYKQTASKLHFHRLGLILLRFYDST
jgi:hypothetical protein